jgi:hypothetical protein
MSNDKKDLRTFIQELPSGKYRLLSPSEIEKAIEAEKNLKDLTNAYETSRKALLGLQRTCDHPYCYDIVSFIYNERHCMVCGHIDLI